MKTFVRNYWACPVSHQEVEQKWKSWGFTFGVFRDPPGQEWNNFVHDTDEFVLVSRGTLVVDVGEEQQKVQAGDLVQIPRNVKHSLKTISRDGSEWLYGYGNWGAIDE